MHLKWPNTISFALFIIFCAPLLSNLDEKHFNEVNNIIYRTQAPKVAHTSRFVTLKEIYHGFGGAFRVDSAWKPPQKNHFIVTLTGKVPQSESMNMNGYAIVACHEFGHILGTGPKQSNYFSGWSSVEGEADYFATKKCLWDYVDIVKSKYVIDDFDRGMVKMCDYNFPNDTKKILGCLRIMSGIQAMVGYFNSTNDISEPISINKQDATKVSKTLEKYPSPQCRVDTWIAGLLDEPRPRCWFAG